MPDDIVNNINQGINFFKERHPEFEPSDEAREMLLGWILERNLPINYNIEAAVQANKQNWS
jgi:hypothetical protein